MPDVTVASAAEGGVSPSPSSPYFAVEVAELALGQIGAFSVNDEAADPYELARTLRWLDIVLAEVAGTFTCWWLIKETIRFPWPADTRTDTVANIMADFYPPAGIVNPISATLVDADGRAIRDLPLVRRHVYDDLPNKDDVGQPELLYFGRQATEQMLSIYRVPDVDTWYVDLVAQTYAPSVLGTQGQTDQAGQLPHGFGQEWQGFLVDKLSAKIGNGPVRQKPLANVKAWDESAERSFAKLEAFANREKKSQPSRTRRWS